MAYADDRINLIMLKEQMEQFPTEKAENMIKAYTEGRITSIPAWEPIYGFDLAYINLKEAGHELSYDALMKIKGDKVNLDVEADIAGFLIDPDSYQKIKIEFKDVEGKSPTSPTHVRRIAEEPEDLSKTNSNIKVFRGNGGSQGIGGGGMAR